jgi:hypothetical protein
MCDKCARIFSENEEDWASGTAVRKRRREDGSRYNETIDEDRCPQCASGSQAVHPRIAMLDTKPADPELYREWLEQQAGVVPGTVVP